MHQFKTALRVVAVVCLVLSALAWAGQAAAIDCKDQAITCWGPAQDPGGQMVACGTVQAPTRLIFLELVCAPRGDFCMLRGKCNGAYPSCCKDGCMVHWKGWQGSEKSCPPGFQPPY